MDMIQAQDQALTSLKSQFKQKQDECKQLEDEFNDEALVMEE